MRDIKGIILDVDGVIVGEKIGFNSPNPNIEVINKLREIKVKGIPISLCTAKPQFSIRKIIDDAGLDNFHITDGGGVIIDSVNNKIRKKNIIDKKLAVEVLNICIQNNIYTEFYTVDNYYIEQNQVSEITKKHIHILQKEPNVVEDLINESVRCEITKIMPIALDNEDKVRVTEIFNNSNIDLDLSWGIHPVALPLQFGIVTAKGITKKQGAIEISKGINVPLENILAVGDSTSDWQFINLCGYCATMGNASQELKDLVKSKGEEYSYVGGHVDKNGILDILNHFEDRMR